MAEGPNKSPASVLRLQLMLRGEGMASPMLRYAWGLSQLRQGDELGTLLPFAELNHKGLGQKASWNLKLHRHQRFPTLNDLFWSPGGNPELRPELGWESRAKASISMGSVEAYAGILRDAIFWIPTGSVWMPRNVESLRRIGMNLNSTWQRGPWQSQIAAQWVYSINNFGLRMPYVAPFTLNIPLRYQHKKWEFEVFNRLRSATPTAWSTSRDTWIGPQFQLDASLRWQGSKSSVEFALTNATNQPIYLQLGYPLPGRQLSLTWHFPLTGIAQ
jgi:iron complex outermembrane receptor protein